MPSNDLLYQFVRRSGSLYDPVTTDLDLDVDPGAFEAGSSRGMLDIVTVALNFTDVDDSGRSEESLLESERTSSFDERRYGNHSIFVVKKDLRKRLRERYAEVFKLSRKRQSHPEIFCFNEMSYPTPAFSGDESFRYGPLEVELQEYADDKNAIILGGSYHHPEELKNVSPIFFPGPASPLHHAKIRSADRLGEKIVQAAPSEHRIYDSMYGKFAMLICLDVLDPSCFLRIARHNVQAYDVIHGAGTSKDANKKPLSFVFVPSYNPKPSRIEGINGDMGAAGSGLTDVQLKPNTAVEDSCKLLSRVANCVVFYVDLRLDVPTNKAFLWGEECGEHDISEFYHCTKVESEFGSLILRHEINSLILAQELETFHRKHLDNLTRTSLGGSDIESEGEVDLSL